MGTCPTCGKRYAAAAFCPADGSALAPTADAAADDGVPTTIDRYRVLRRIGQGGMSEVFEAEHVDLGRKVALKLLRRELARDAKAVERFRREARTTSALGHPNVIRVLDFGHADDGALYLVMEWLAGETLADWLARGPVPLDLALELVEQICAGLAAAHSAGVVHRDMKPANVLVADDGRGGHVAKILDFGIAKLAQAETSLTRTGSFVGTPDYVAPEQALGEDLDGRADLYSVGVMLYELVTGTVPFTGEGLMAVIHAHAVQKPEPPSRRAPDRAIEPELEALILRCLEKEPSRRFASIAELGAALHALRGGSAASYFAGLRADGTEPDALVAPAEVGTTTQPITQPELAERAPDPHEVAREPTAPAPPAPPAPLAPAAPEAVDDAELDDVVPRRGRGPVLALVAAAVALGLAGWWWLTQPDVDSASGTRDAAAVDAGSPGPARPPDGGPAPEPPTWKYLGRDGELELTVWARPRPIAPGQPFSLDLELVPTDALRPAFVPPLELSLTFEYFKDHRIASTARATLAPDGRARIETTLPIPGKHHVVAEVRRADKPIARARFDLCVGADPATPSAELERLCPRMKPSLVGP